MNGSLTYYRSVMVYGNDNQLLYMLTLEGMVSRSEGSAGTSYTYNYFKTDYLGCTRAMLNAMFISRVPRLLPFALFPFTSPRRFQDALLATELRHSLIDFTRPLF